MAVPEATVLPCCIRDIACPASLNVHCSYDLRVQLYQNNLNDFFYNSTQNFYEYCFLNLQKNNQRNVLLSLLPRKLYTGNTSRKHSPIQKMLLMKRINLPVFTFYFTDPTLCLGIYLFSQSILQIRHCALVFTCFRILFYRSDTVPRYLPVFTFYSNDLTLCLGIYLFSHSILQIRHCALVFTSFHSLFYRSDTVPRYLPLFAFYFTDPTLCLGIYLFLHSILQIRHCALIFTCFRILFYIGIYLFSHSILQI